MKKLQQDARRAHQILAQIARAEAPIEASVTELRTLGDTGLNTLAASVEAEDLPTRRAAALVLSQMNTRRALAPILNSVVKFDDHPELAAALLYTAAGLLKPRDKERVRPFLLRCLQSRSATVRLAAVECVRATEDDLAMSAIIEQNKTANKQPPSRAGAFLSKVPPASQVTVPRAASMDLIAALASPNETKRSEARQALLEHPDRNRVIVEHLYDANPYLRLSVLESASVIKNPDWHTALLDIANEAALGDHERSLALRGVARASDAGEDDKLLLSFLSSASMPVRAEAARLAIATTRTQMINAALDLLIDDEPWVRKRLADGWASVADACRERDLPALISILVRADWLKQPNAFDVDAFQSLCGGITRTVELGGRLSAEHLEQFGQLRSGRAPDISEAASRTYESLSRSVNATTLSKNT